MARRAAVISIDVNAGTAKMLVGLEKGKAGLREFGGVAGLKSCLKMSFIYFLATALSGSSSKTLLNSVKASSYLPRL